MKIKSENPGNYTSVKVHFIQDSEFATLHWRKSMVNFVPSLTYHDQNYPDY